MVAKMVVLRQFVIVISSFAHIKIFMLRRQTAGSNIFNLLF